MASVTYQQLTAFLVIHPYNDFVSEGRKVWHRLEGLFELADALLLLLSGRGSETYSLSNDRGRSLYKRYSVFVATKESLTIHNVRAIAADVVPAFG